MTHNPPHPTTRLTIGPRRRGRLAAEALAVLLMASAPAIAVAQAPPPLPPLPTPPVAVAAPPTPVVMAPEAVDRGGLWRRWKARRAAAKRHLQQKALGFPEQFHEPPLGHFVSAHARTQVSNGNAAQMVLHDFDFVPGTDRLNAKGADRLAAIAAMLPTNFFPVLIERTQHAPGLDERRRLAVLDELGRGPFPVPPQRVAIISPDRGMAGLDAELVNQNLRIQTLTGGAYGGIGGGAIGGAIGQGFDASGPGQGQRPR